MNLLTYILVFNLLGSIISLLGGVLLLTKGKFAYKIAPYLSAFAAGTLLGTVFFDLLPEAVSEGKSGISVQWVFLITLFGILFFFVLERLLHWFHHHGFEEHAIKEKPIIPLIVAGDTVHNFIDGVAIAATFASSIPLGIITTLAVGIHEIPQEIGDFGVMLKNGLSRGRVLWVNVLSAVASFGGALLAFYFGSQVQGLATIFLSVSAGFFLYISLSDLIPEIHSENKKGLAFLETLCIFLGVATIYFALFVVRSIFGLDV